MEKEFVPFDLTLKLIELGINFKSLGGYADGELFLWQDNDTTSFMHCEIEAPLWQQAFDWFRENHNLHYSIRNDGTYNSWHFSRWGKRYETYEEARQACLEKLIEIVENKKQ